LVLTILVLKISKNLESEDIMKNEVECGRFRGLPLTWDKSYDGHDYDPRLLSECPPLPQAAEVQSFRVYASYYLLNYT
jgi:hypothetical protein